MDRPRMQDIADEAGVGKATVSLALRDDPRIRLETRERIKEIALRLGYQSNPTVANLMAQLRASREPRYQATLAFLNACPNDPELRSSPSFQDWLRGARTRAKSLGYEIDFFWMFEPGVTASRRLKILESRNIRGFILAGSDDKDLLNGEHAVLLDSFAAVTIGRRLFDPPLHQVSNDHYLTSMLATRKVIQRGYRRPGLVLPESCDQMADLRLSAGFLSARQPLSPAAHLPVHYLQGEAEFAAWFQQHQPDAVLTLDRQVAEWMEGMPATGLVHLDWHDDLASWTGMNQNNQMVGAAAVDALIGQLHRNESGVPAIPRTILISSSWMEGNTLPPVGPQ